MSRISNVLHHRREIASSPFLVVLAPRVTLLRKSTIAKVPAVARRLEPSCHERDFAMNIGVFMPNWVGDVVMATPAVRALRKLVGAGRLIGVMRPYVAEVLDGAEWFDHVVLYAKRPENAELAWKNAKRRLQANNLDVAVLLTNSLRTGWMAWQSGAKERIGMAGNLRSPLLTTRVYAPRKGRRAQHLPAIDSYLQLATAAGCPPETPTLELATTDNDREAAEQAWRQLGLPSNAPVAVFNTGGAFGAAKDWPADHFAQLAGRLVRGSDIHVLINCGPAERETARNIVAAADHPRVTSLADIEQLPIGLTKAAIRRSQLLVTTDSGPRFFGIAFGVPTVTLFGPTNTEWTRTYNGSETSLSLNLDCQPCMSRVCPLKHHRCMQDLSVDRVYEAALTALRRNQSQAA
ncbi:glycosyltransferase family 9 protein [Pirellulales bacterium]|nr:glycosyltransferase family 9 protein [Pirellulales bacterium]